ncbi:cysteine proteinase [Auricularia subglabra TFB-10046 SS5]|uniref:Cysteine proteinase n=1 Tax=Auricularia subglabra (strain TFB-10046 / SS5) TaxID=717982 RepID=J0D2H6_AURST|nr:cysteine proteinase [Auricularia subglabra TFB-10046 SS5]
MWNNAKQRARVFKSVQATEFWRRNAILIPIYEDEHWMLAIAYPRHSKIDFFDSMGLRSRHAKTVAHLVSSLLELAHGRRFNNAIPTPTSWSSRAHVKPGCPRQYGAVDCGLWVLTVVAAVLRAFRTTALLEHDMPNFRMYMYTLINKHIPPVMPR